MARHAHGAFGWTALARIITGGSLLLLLGWMPVYGAVLQVGPTRPYKTPCAAIVTARAGDTIEIDASTYTNDSCTWSKDNLTIRGVSGRPHIHSSIPSIPNRKGIWVIGGSVNTTTTIENIEISGAAVADRNGAGIRYEGQGNITLRHVYCHDNENGILTGNPGTGDVFIESSEFARNGFGDGLSQNIYIGRVHTFTLQYSFSHDAKKGHLVKTRAATNYILYNRLTDSPGGESSYEIDLPNGGVSYIIGNVIRQDASTDNSTIITHGEEGATHAQQELYIVNNTVVNDRATGTFIRTQGSLTVQTIVNNLFVGSGTVLLADGVPQTPAHNLLTTLQLAGFADAAQHNYQLTARSPAIDRGIDPGSAHGMSLFPGEQYLDPLTHQTRTIVGRALDIGAYEYGLVPTPYPLSRRRTTSF
jgi:hypothetical protein